MPPEPRLRVSIPIRFYPPEFAGCGIQLQRTIPHLRTRGIDVTVLTQEPTTGRPMDAQGGDGVDRLLTPGSGRLAEIRRVLQLRRYYALRPRAFDLVHSNIIGWEFMLNVRYMKSLQLPVMYEMILLGADDPVTISRERFATLKTRLLRGVDYWGAVSEAFRSRVQSAGISTDRFRLLYPGVDVATYRPLPRPERRALRARLGLPGDGRIVVTVGSVIHRKGVDRLLNAWRLLAPRPGLDLLVIVGPVSLTDGLSPGDIPYASAQRELSTQPDLAGTVEWTGCVNNVHEYLQAADLFAFLSRQEGLGIVILEALSCGLPCIVSPLDGIAAEMVRDGVTGRIMPRPDDTAAVAASMADLLGEPARGTAMSDLARKTIVDGFTFDARADALASLYREMARRRET